MQEYIVLVRLVDDADNKVYLRNSRITLSDERAKIHLKEGNVALIDDATPPPTEPTGPTIIKPAKPTKLAKVEAQ